MKLSFIYTLILQIINSLCKMKEKKWYIHADNNFKIANIITLELHLKDKNAKLK